MTVKLVVDIAQTWWKCVNHRMISTIQTRKSTHQGGLFGEERLQLFFLLPELDLCVQSMSVNPILVGFLQILQQGY